MPNLVGTSLNQVPTNSMLGGMAYQDPNHVSIKDLDLRNISQINSEIADNAVDIFVYDTSKDSDGGAWRYRTQSTSWYNEPLNTATRGSRKEFPAVAVIVTTTTKVTIYDADDPHLPMWMVFLSGPDSSNERLLRYADNNASEMLNAILCVSTNDTLVYISFIDEYHNLYHSTASYYFPGRTGIIDRNVIISEPNIINNSRGVGVSNTNDVAMTVLPTAPIDPSTGLQVPTIAVATTEGLAVIRDDKAVVTMYTNDAGERPIKQIGFTKSNKLIFRHNFNWVYYYEIPASDMTASYWNAFHGFIGRFTSVERTWADGPHGNALPINAPSNIDEFLEDKAMGHINGVDILAFNEERIGYGMHAGISTDFNTGYQHGDIKGAFLSDTYTGADFGPELITGGDFSNASDWSLGTGWSINGSGQAVHSSGSAGYIQQSGSFTQGKYYQLTADLISGNPGNFGIVNHNTVGTPQPHNGSTVADVYCVGGGKIYAMWKQSGTNLSLINLYANNAVTIDNVSIKEISRFYYDRSINNKPLVLTGSLTKTPIATGADLVAYSGFSNNNALFQAYNSDLNPGTGDYSFICWFKTTSTSTEEIIMRRFANPTVTGGMMLRIVNSNSKLQWYVRDIFSNAYTVNSFRAVDDNVWHCAVGTREGGIARLYLDGKLEGTANITTNSHDPGTTAKLCIGAEEVTNSPGTFQNPADFTSLALVRYSLTAPTAEQVKKIYNDERCFFYENAKATLYGSSNAVTALAHDDTTSLLYVGTSSGRSAFSGLKRVENTTTAVTTAISAQDDLIAQQ